MMSKDRLPMYGFALALLLSLIPALCFAAGPLAGSMVSTAGDVNGDGYSDLLVCHPTPGGGEVDVFLGSADGSLTLQRQLSTGEAGSNFGAAVACAGDVNGDGYDDIVIGQPLHNHVALGVGQVWIFLGGSTGIGETPPIKIEGLEAGGHFGAAVCTAGDMNVDGYDDVVVGAPESAGGGPPGTLRGRATIYSGSASGLTLLVQLAVNGNGNNEHLGASVSGGCDINADGYDDVVLGAPFTGGGTNGAILLVHGSPSGAIFVISDQLSGPVDSFGFGASVAEVGDWNGDGYADVVVGAPQSNTIAFIACGKAYLVPGGVGGLPPVPTLLMTGAENSEYVGQWVTCAGDRNGDGLGDLAIGAPGASGPLGANQGLVAVRFGHIINPAAADTLYGIAAGAQFGTFVSGAGEIAGNGFADLAVVSPGGGPGGRVDLYPGGVVAAARSPQFALDSQNPGATYDGDQFGIAVSEGGDLNGDGFGDALIGAPGETATVTGEGVVQTLLGFRGNAASIVNYDRYVHGGQAGSRFGAAVDFAGDVDGDGYDDVVVGAPGDAHAFPGAGRAYLFRGGMAGLDTVAVWTADGGAAADAFGASVCGAGDVNRDGYADIAVGSPGADGGSGKLSVYYGSPTGPTSAMGAVVSGATPGDSLGARVAAAGDLNGDGYDDLLVGAPGHNGSQGQVVVLYGGPNTPATTSTISTTLGPGARFGSALAGRGDSDLDGLADAAIGAPGADGNAPGSGLVEIHRGSTGGLNGAPAQVISGLSSGDAFGTAVSFGDFNADGRSDLAVGAPGLDWNSFFGFRPNAGGVYLCASNAGGQFVLPDTVYRRSGADSAAGTAVTMAGDFNGDGFADVVEGEPFNRYGDTPGGTFGIAMTFMGGGMAQTFERLPRQLKTGGAAPLALEGGVKASDGFALSMHARTPAGRQRIRVQWQAGPVSTPFSAMPMNSLGPFLGNAPDTVGVQYDLSWNVTGMPDATPVHWRTRVRSHAPWFAYTPWLTPAGNASTLADVDIVQSPVGVEGLDPARVALAAPWPNPARGPIALTFSLPSAGDASLAVFDVRGRLVRQLVQGRLPAGTATRTWDGTDDHARSVGAGVYFARLRVGNETSARRLVRLL